MNKAPLCQCNHCYVILIDENPQINAPEYDLTGEELEMLREDDGDGSYWVCPVCLTDDYLQDEITIKQYTPIKKYVD
jgi:hypothetical protein